jgi:hypothetical protein
MAAGLGFKDFTTGEVLTAADVDGYLMQGVWVFASAAARDAAVTSPQEGNFAYLKDTNVTTYYTGSAWANLDTTGMTNPMTTTGDTIYSSSGSKPARLGIGSTGQVLTVSGGVPTWATPTSTTFPAFEAYRGTDQTISSGVWTKAQLNTESFDTNNNFDPTTNYRFTPTVAGYYQINALAYIYAVSGTGNAMMSIYKNGTQYKTWIINGTTGAQVGLGAVIYFNGSTDYIEMYCRNTASGNSIISAGPTDNYLNGVGIRS